MSILEDLRNKRKELLQQKADRQEERRLIQEEKQIKKEIKELEEEDTLMGNVKKSFFSTANYIVSEANDIAFGTKNNGKKKKR